MNCSLLNLKYIDYLLEKRLINGTSDRLLVSVAESCLSQRYAYTLLYHELIWLSCLKTPAQGHCLKEKTLKLLGEFTQASSNRLN